MAAKAKEETGDAKHMAMSHDHRIPPDPYAYLPQVSSFVLESNDARDGEPLDPKFATLLVDRQQGQLTGAALVGLSEGNSQLCGHLL